MSEAIDTERAHDARVAAIVADLRERAARNEARVRAAMPSTTVPVIVFDHPQR